MTKKNINKKIKSLSIELDKKTQLKELNGIIKNFKENTDKKYEVKINLSFSLDSGIVTLSRERKPYLKLVKNKWKKTTYKLLIILAKKLDEKDYKLATHVILASRHGVNYGYTYTEQFLDEAQNFYHKFKNCKKLNKLTKKQYKNNIINFTDFIR